MDVNLVLFADVVQKLFVKLGYRKCNIQYYKLFFRESLEKFLAIFKELVIVPEFHLCLFHLSTPTAICFPYKYTKCTFPTWKSIHKKHKFSFLLRT
jgi:hypothetical protein